MEKVDCFVGTVMPKEAEDWIQRLRTRAGEIAQLEPGQMPPLGSSGVCAAVLLPGEYDLKSMGEVLIEAAYNRSPLRFSFTADFGSDGDTLFALCGGDLSSYDALTDMIADKVGREIEVLQPRVNVFKRCQSHFGKLETALPQAVREVEPIGDFTVSQIALYTKTDWRLGWMPDALSTLGGVRSAA